MHQNKVCVRQQLGLSTTVESITYESARNKILMKEGKKIIENVRK
jgi:hypothetical protein